MADADVLGESQVAAAVTQPATADVTAMPVYDQPPPIDDLGLEVPDVPVELAVMPDPEPVTFEIPELETEMADFAEPELEPEPVAAADDSTDDLGLS
jgi:hypothetical protein